MTFEPVAPVDSAASVTSAAPAVAPAAEATPAASAAAPAPASTPLPVARLSALTRVLLAVAALASVLALGLAAKLWSDAQNLQKLVNKQVADMHLQTRESNTVARMANDQSRDANTKVTLLEGKVSELNAQRTQLDSVLQSLARAKDDTLLADVDAAIQLGQQQSQLTGSVQPVLAALLSAEKRLAGTSQVPLQSLHQTVQHDIDRLKRTNVSDVPTLVGKIDGVMRQMDTLPLQASAVPPMGAHVSSPASAPVAAASAGQAAWWQNLWGQLRNGMVGLVRVREIDNRDAALLEPEKGYYLRENLKLRLLNARIALLARQPELSKNDIAAVRAQIGKYFDGDSPLVKSSLAVLEDVQQQTYAAELPAITDTLAALSAARAAPGAVGTRN